MRSPVVKIGAVVIGAVTALAVLHYKPWKKSQVAAGRASLEVGFLPVT
jgi:hypothetical protein